jgi:hypothetical protein
LASSGLNDYHLSLKKLSVQQVRSLIVPGVISAISTYGHRGKKKTGS